MKDVRIIKAARSFFFYLRLFFFSVPRRLFISLKILLLFFLSSMSDRYRHSLQLKPHSNRHLKSLTCSNYSLYIGFLSFDSFNDRELMVIIYRPSSGISLIFLSPFAVWHHSSSPFDYTALDSPESLNLTKRVSTSWRSNVKRYSVSLLASVKFFFFFFISFVLNVETTRWWSRAPSSSAQAKNI